MMSIVYILWMYVVLFAIVGAMRGWAKELLVIFSVITALAVNFLLEAYIPIVRDLPKDSKSLFWIRTLVLLGLVFFGYQTVLLLPRFASKAARERLQDSLFGAVIGGFNGYLIAGTIIFYLSQANYPYPNVISPPPPGPIADSVASMMQYLPPRWLGVPGIYFAVIIILIFLIVVYI